VGCGEEGGVTGWLFLAAAVVVAVVVRGVMVVMAPLKTHEACDGKGCSFCNWQGKRAKFGAKTVGRMTGRPLPEQIR
jgi:hypothetical protein